MIDFKENIDSLEKMVWNFVLNPDNEFNELKPKSHDSLSRQELITLFKPGYFNEEARQESFKWALKFFREYDKIPNKKELRSYLEVSNANIEEEAFAELYSFNLQEYNYTYLYDYVKSFIMLKNLNMTVIDTLTYLKTVSVHPDNIGRVSEQVRNDISNKLALNFSNADTGLNFFDTDSHVQITKSGSPTGFQFFDKTLGGGWNAKSLVVLIGKPKIGKSLVLGNIAARSFLQGNVTGLVTVELSDRQYMKRIGSNLLTVKGDEYSGIVTANQAKQLSDKINALRSGNGLNGELHIKEMMTGGATAIDIENYFLRLEGKMNKRFKVIIVDYLNLLRPLKEQNGMYEKIKAISEELRGVAMRNEWCIISASQVKRDAVTNYDLGMESIAESFGLVHTVDSMYGLMRAPLESRMKIKVIANRDNGYEESYKFYTMHKDYFRLTEEIGHNSEFYSDDVAASRLEEEVREENNSVMIGNSKRIIEPNYGDLLDSL